MKKNRQTDDDPDLTDSSDDDEGSPQKREIEVSDHPTPEAATKKQGNRLLRDPSSCGAYRRPNGRWHSEITFENSRIYLGTFATKEEARKAYLSKKSELEAAKLSGGDGGGRTGNSVVEEYPKKRKKSHQPNPEAGKRLAEIRDPIEKSGGDGGGGSGDSVVQGSSKGKRKSQRPYPGVFLRWGRWYAEVRDPIKKRKKWLGHYPSPEEARDAIEAKKLEFDAIRMNLEKGELGGPGTGDGESVGCGDWAIQGCGSSDSGGGGESSELAVLKRFTEGGGVDLNSVMQIASHIIDSNGNFVGEFSSLDDLQIR